MPLCNSFIVACSMSLLLGATSPLELMNALPDPSYIKANRLDRNATRGEASILYIHSHIQRAYGVPASFEWPYVLETRSSEPAPSIEFEFKDSEPLSAVLDRLVLKSKGRLKWETLRDSIVIRPESSGGAMENNLDVTVSVSLKGVSTWDAVKEVVRVVNRQNKHQRLLDVTPDFLLNGYCAPPGFVEKNDITLKLTNVSAREALCAIIQASCLDFSYTYSNYYRPVRQPNSTPVSHLTLWFFADGKRFRSPELMPRSEIVRWNQEIEALRHPSPGR